jgi:hypothetical protein
MDLMGYTAEDLFREYMDHAMKMVTWDLDAIREYGKNYIGVHTYNYVPLGGKKFQVAYSSCPEATGYNVIPLNVPNAGTTITTNFTALKAVSRLAEGDPATFLNGNSVYEASGKKAYNSNVHLAKRGFRLGYKYHPHRQSPRVPAEHIPLPKALQPPSFFVKAYPAVPMNMFPAQI